MRPAAHPFALVSLLLLVHCVSTASKSSLGSDVDRILAANRDKSIAVAYYDLRTGASLLRNERAVFHAASTMKVPVMFTIFEAVSQGRLRLEQPVRVKNEFVSIFDRSLFSLDPKDDSDKSLYEQVGRELPLRELVRRMIVRSSNLATNNVIELVGARNVVDLMRRIGAKDIQVLRGVEDQKAYEAGMNNTTTAYDLMLTFRVLADRKVVSPEASAQMIEILSGQEFNRGIPAGLPRGTRVAHKTGDLTRVDHDSGIVFPANGSPYVLVVLTRGFRTHRQANRTIAAISRAVWRWRESESRKSVGEMPVFRSHRNRLPIELGATARLRNRERTVGN